MNLENFTCFSRNISPYISQSSDKVMLKRDTTSTLKHFFSLFQDSSVKIIENVYVYSVNENIILEESKYLDATIRSYIQYKMKYVYHYTIHLNGRTMYVNLFTSGKDKKYERYMKFIYMWMYFISSFSMTTCTNILQIDIYFTHMKKQKPMKKDVIGPFHVNSGYTYAGCHSFNTIVIYREEEWFKVLIHETMHAFALDFSYINNDYMNNGLRNIFPILSNINAYEAYCETWANLLHTFFTCYLQHNNNFTKCIHLFRSMYLNECKFSFYQMTKILDNMGLSYENLYNDDNNVSKIKYRVNTNVFSYYILKTIFLQHINEFIALCSTQENVLKFNISFSHQDRVIEFVRKYHQNFKYIWYPSMKDIPDKERRLLKRSMRMVLYDVI